MVSDILEESIRDVFIPKDMEHLVLDYSLAPSDNFAQQTQWLDLKFEIVDFHDDLDALIENLGLDENIKYFRTIIDQIAEKIVKKVYLVHHCLVCEDFEEFYDLLLLKNA